MNDISYWLLPPLVGAIIGYITNWLAIKMLFRPYDQLRLFGRRLPFTPGVIPARRDQLADKIGETVSIYLINEEELHRALQEPRVRDELALRLQSGWRSQITQDASLWETLCSYKQLPVETLEAALAKGADLLVQAILRQMRLPQSRHHIIEMISELVGYLSERQLSKESADRIVSLLVDALQRLADDPARIQELDAKLDIWLAALMSRLANSTLSLRQLLGEDAENALRQMIATLEPQIISMTEKFLQQESLAEQLTLQVQEWLNRQVFLSMLTAFMSQDRWVNLIQRLLSDVGEYLSREDNREALSRQLLRWLQDRLEDPLSLWVARIGEDKLLAIMQHIKQRLLQELAEERTRDWLRRQAQQLSGIMQGYSLQSLASSQGYTELLDNLPERVWQQAEVYLYGEQARHRLNELVLRQTHSILHQPLKDVLVLVQPSQNVFTTVAEWLLGAAAGQAATLLQTLDISLIVRRRLSEFPMAEIEKLTLEIAGRELSTITALGGLLGAIIGLSQLLIG